MKSPIVLLQYINGQTCHCFGFWQPELCLWESCHLSTMWKGNRLHPMADGWYYILRAESLVRKRHHPVHTNVSLEGERWGESFPSHIVTQFGIGEKWLGKVSLDSSCAVMFHFARPLRQSHPKWSNSFQNWTYLKKIKWWAYKLMIMNLILYCFLKGSSET